MLYKKKGTGGGREPQHLDLICYDDAASVSYYKKQSINYKGFGGLMSRETSGGDLEGTLIDAVDTALVNNPPAERPVGSGYG